MKFWVTYEDDEYGELSADVRSAEPPFSDSQYATLVCNVPAGDQDLRDRAEHICSALSRQDLVKMLQADLLRLRFAVAGRDKVDGLAVALDIDEMIAKITSES